MTGTKSLVLLLIILVSTTGNAQLNKIYTAVSPDRSTRVEAGTDRDGQLVYRIVFNGNPVVTWSPLGFILDSIHAGEHTVIKSKTQRSFREKFAWPLGEDDSVSNVYNEITLSCQSAALPFDVTARVFDGSVAFRYRLPEQAAGTGSRITRETTAFHFTGPYTLYQYNEESVFTPVAIDTFGKRCDFPATLTNGRWYISVGEANNAGYTKAELLRGAAPHSLAVTFNRDTAVQAAGSYSMPWRTVSIAATATGLHAFSTLPLKLNPPPAGGVPAWIKPGKLIRAQLNTKSALDCIDFSVKHNFRYIMFDAGWYGAEVRTSSDPTKVIPAIDMPMVIQYGKERGIGVLLYVNYIGLKTRLDTILSLYKQWGVSGMKFGFVDGLSQNGLTWLTDAIRKVNSYGFILNIHDNYKPTGLSRTFPALLTQEGIRGDENSPDAFHTTVLPFTRFLAGPADFTFCYPNAINSYSKNLKVTKAQQMALTVIYFSPLQSVFWYGNPNDYTNEEEIEFFRYVPTVWNESHYLAGRIGKGISVARRSGDTWFLGNAAGLEDWKSTIRMSFLNPGRQYTATIYSDDGRGGIKKSTLLMKKGDTFPVTVKASGGLAMIIEPVK